MKKNFDITIIGLGAHGSSAIYHLSKTGFSVCGIDRFQPPHAYGSSHGESRIIRQAYHESPMYVPIVKQAYNLWNELEEISGEKLFLKTGGLMLGDENAAVIKGAKFSAETHNIAYEYLSANEIRYRFPALNASAETVAVLETEAGILFPKACIKTNLELANDKVTLLFNEVVKSIKPQNNFVEIITDKGNYKTEILIISAGAWLDNLMPDLHLPLTIERQVLYWFNNKNQQLQQNLLPHKLPIFIWQSQADKMFYGFPDLGNGIKIAPHHAGKKINPNVLSQEVDKKEIDDMQNLVDDYLNMEANFSATTVCMYTNTPDENFIIDHHPEHKNIIIASPCSGHGFKFSSVIGKVLCEMATKQPLSFDISPFRISRFFGQ